MRAPDIRADAYGISDPGRIALGSVISGLVGAALCALAFWVDRARFFHAYLTAYTFAATTLAGALFFLLLHHLTGARWSVSLRRLVEALVSTTPLLLILFVPVALGMADLYPWSRPGALAADPHLEHKAAYLNVPFFLIRAALILGIWCLLSGKLSRLSLRQDTVGGDISGPARKWSAIGMILLAFTLTGASFDWLMSLDDRWYSTIFGVYVFSGSVLAALAVIVLIALFLRRRGLLRDLITVEHYHDLGKLLFGFTIFWAYIAFSQYFLIWYGNLPEESTFFLHRWQGGWRPVSLLIVLGHFALPFLVLISRAAKRNLWVLAGMGIWLLIFHWIDIYWMVLPNLRPQVAALSWPDAAAALAVGGFFTAAFWRRLVRHPLVAYNDPQLEASRRFENA